MSQVQSDQLQPLNVGDFVATRYKGAYCSATIKDIERVIKVKVQFQSNLGIYIIDENDIRGTADTGKIVKAKLPNDNRFCTATVIKVLDESLYTVIFDDDETLSVRRSKLRPCPARHYLEGDSLDNFPLINPDKFGNPALKGNVNFRKKLMDYGQSQHTPGGTVAHFTRRRVAAKEASRRATVCGNQESALEDTSKTHTIQSRGQRLSVDGKCLLDSSEGCVQTEDTESASEGGRSSRAGTSNSSPNSDQDRYASLDSLIAMKLSKSSPKAENKNKTVGALYTELAEIVKEKYQDEKVDLSEKPVIEGEYNFIPNLDGVEDPDQRQKLILDAMKELVVEYFVVKDKWDKLEIKKKKL